KKTLDQLAPPESASGVAVICVPRGRERNGFDIGFEIQSDGKTIRPGSTATDWSKKLPIYEEIMDGKSVDEFFARAKDGSFCNEALQDLAVRNEAFDLKWLVPAAIATHKAEQVSADNVAGIVMLSHGSQHGKYILQVPVKYKHGDKEMYRNVAYVVTRENDTLNFVAGLTRYSVDRFSAEGCALNTPYNLGELKGFILHVLQITYSKALGTPYDKFPDNLKSQWVRAKSASAVQTDEGPAPREEEEPV
ncbi:MAG: hypothetical protein G01um101466_747, partial [Parcubacteria group bacterium Gr01-1014_66]